MSVNKKYVANNRQSLLLILMLPSRGQISLEFNSGYGLNSEGFYLTNDEALQAVLESDKRFNKTYRLAEIDGISLVEYNARKEMRENNLLPEEPKEPEPKSFRTSQDAKEWLHKEFAVPYALILNKDKIKAKALELGFDVTFENDQN